MFEKQQIHFGSGVSSRLPDILEGLNARKVFLVTGSQSFDNLFPGQQLRKLIGGCEVYRHHGFQVNPQCFEIIDGLRKLQQFKPDVVIAIGGGSVIDTGKLISALGNADSDVYDTVRNGVLPDCESIPLIVLPTTAGSGSEATHFAVVYINDQKYSVGDARLLPEVVLLDPALTRTMSRQLTAISGMDALSQAIESFWSLQCTPDSLRYASESIQLNLEAFEGAVIHADALCREKMLKASYLAGCAINVTKTTAIHAFSYHLTKKYDVPHGQAVGFLLSVFFDFYNEAGWELEMCLGREYEKLLALFNVSGFGGLSDIIQRRMKLGGIDMTFQEIGMTEPIQFDQFFHGVNLERLGNHPVKIDETFLEYLKNKHCN
ncbi:phosphonoacetaldehyde reductase [Alkaliflexus imshenetskii]|uniref:phosphonoacetaldehyde reductase n=1 Tax=Alkaliflexus imshenetskii TaxID=286730 RepID=UPI0004AF502F|nr:phosphonoacetaldehyde reductase [Alkaliflexus imshenetskii]